MGKVPPVPLTESSGETGISNPGTSNVVKVKEEVVAGTKRKSRGSLDIGRNFNRFII